MLCEDSALAATETPDQQAQEFIQYFDTEIRPREIAVALAWWNANVSGKDEDFAAKEEAENKLNEALANHERFAQVKSLKEAAIRDAQRKRQIELLYLRYVEKQVDPELLKRITSKSNEIEQKFNVYRAQVGNDQLTDSQVRKILRESADPVYRKAVWESSKQVGQVVAADLRQLVELRNEAARRLGFADYHAMQLALNEQSQQEVLKLFDQLDQLTREPFAEAKHGIDRRLASRYGIEVAELRPWHYHDPFFQDAPHVYDTDVDSVFRDVDILRICRQFYAGIGLPIDDVLKRSDLFERPGKSPHAFCTDIDREGDVRVLANIVSNEYWMGTMLHELGHAVYSSQYIPSSLPFVLRTDAHILCTEGVAMMFERFSKNPHWLIAMKVQVPDPESFQVAGAQMRRDELLIFSRWCQVMLRFEQSMYADPSQDLNKLWWDLVEKYQLVHRPEDRQAADYASKIHVVSAPAYYHNYMMGQLFACQLHAAIVREVLGQDHPAGAYYYDDARVGQFMRDKVFKVGRLLPWNELTRYATGQPLGAQAFAAEFRDEL
jgi:peptidyl-dipeptidase A